MTNDYKWENGNVKPVPKNTVEGQQSMFFDDNMNLSAGDEVVVETHPEIINEDGSDGSETALDLIRPGQFDPRNFHREYKDNTKEVLYQLLALQSNEKPLKKGGDEIGYRCDAIILKNRQRYSIVENTLFDIISGRISSHPEDDFYIITAKEVKNLLPYSDKGYIYKIMSKGAHSLNRSPLVFEIPLKNGKSKTLELQWNEALIYNGADSTEDDEDAYISFQPTDFFKMLMTSSTIMHGAHYPIGVSAQINSKYVRNLFYFLESRKNYKEYKTARPGVFKITFDELQVIVGYPESYRTTDIRRFILDAAKNELNSIQGIDFHFDYEMVKDAVETGKKKRYTSVRFEISTSIEGSFIEEEEAVPELPLNDNDKVVIEILKGQGLDERQSRDVLKKYLSNGRDLVFLTQAITKVAAYTNIDAKTGDLCNLMDGKELKSERSSKSNSDKQDKNKFNNFDQRSYDGEDLEKTLLNSNPDF